MRGIAEATSALPIVGPERREGCPWAEVRSPHDGRVVGGCFGLQAGVFTASLDRALSAARRLEFGGVLVNEAPTFRLDQAPYGGVKDSGNTREGPAYQVRELTEPRLLTLQRASADG